MRGQGPRNGHGDHCLVCFDVRCDDVSQLFIAFSLNSAHMQGPLTFFAPVESMQVRLRWRRTRPFTVR